MGTIYLIRAQATCSYKIGFTASPDVKHRLMALQTGSPLVLELVATKRGEQSDEKALHQALARYRTHGEWFDIPKISFVMKYFDTEREDLRDTIAASIANQCIAYAMCEDVEWVKRNVPCEQVGNFWYAILDHFGFTRPPRLSDAQKLEIMRLRYKSIELNASLQGQT